MTNEEHELPEPTAYIWHEHLGERTKSLRWTKPGQWDFAPRVEPLYTEAQVRELLSRHAAAELVQYGNCHYWCPACYADITKPEHRVRPLTGREATASNGWWQVSYNGGKSWVDWSPRPNPERDAGLAMAKVRYVAPSLPVREEPTRWHELKTDPAVWDDVAAERKTFEIRINDRDYKVGDGLRLRKTRYTGWEMREAGYPLEYVGEPLERVVKHVLAGPVYGLAANWVVLSIAPLPASPSTDKEGAAPKDGVNASQDVQAWQHEEDPARVISAAQKTQAERDGGASASSVKPYSVPLTRGVALPLTNQPKEP